MIDKCVPSMAAALEGIADGATVLVGGFAVGTPVALLEGLMARGARDLTIVCIAGGREGTDGIYARLFAGGHVRKLICSFVRSSSIAGELVRTGRMELEIVPQGTLAERVRAGGSGIPAFWTPTGADTLIAEGREIRSFDGRNCLMEHAIRGDVALIEAWRADRWGNLTFRSSGGNMNTIMARAAAMTVVQAHHIAALGDIDPEAVHVPGIFVNRVLHLPYGDPVLPV